MIIPTPSQHWFAITFSGIEIGLLDCMFGGLAMSLWLGAVSPYPNASQAMLHP
jgi:hypothetical protein